MAGTLGSHGSKNTRYSGIAKGLDAILYRPRPQGSTGDDLMCQTLSMLDVLAQVSDGAGAVLPAAPLEEAKHE